MSTAGESSPIQHDIAVSPMCSQIKSISSSSFTPTERCQTPLQIVVDVEKNGLGQFMTVFILFYDFTTNMNDHWSIGEIHFYAAYPEMRVIRD